MHDFDWIKNLANQKELKKLIKKFLKSDPELRACEYFAKPKRKGLPAPIHQDNYYWNVANNKGLTMWIALCPSNKKMVGYIIMMGPIKKVCLNIKHLLQREVLKN